jgi:hypothetical protein
MALIVLCKSLLVPNSFVCGILDTLCGEYKTVCPASGTASQLMQQSCAPDAASTVEMRAAGN